MFDHKTMTYNGTAVAYATLPMYMLNIVMLDDQLTPAAKLVFVRLMAYASAVNSCQFKITNKWLEANTALSERTVIRSLEQLKASGYVNDDGIIYTAPPQEAKRATVKQSLPVQPVPSVQVHHFPDAKKMVEMSKPQANSDQQDEDLDVNEQANAMLASLGIRKKVVISDTKQTANLADQGDNLTVKTANLAVPIITIPNNTLLKNTPTASAEKPAPKKPTEQTEPSGLFSSTSSSGVVGFVEKTKPKPLASFLPTLGKGQTVAIGKPSIVLSPQHTSYIATALQRMKVTSPSERKRYLDEIAYAATQGAFANTYRHTPLKAIHACLNLVEAGKWRANGGMY